MATNGIISIVQGGEVLVKCVAGCNGMKAPQLAEILRLFFQNRDMNLPKIYQICRNNDFGCKSCLVVQTKDSFISDDDELPELYKEKFNDPRFNPRWSLGTAAYTEVVEI